MTNRRYGWKRDAHDPRDHAIKFGAGRPKPLPPAFSVDSMPPVYDQGDSNSCVLQCVAAAMENINLTAGQDEWLPSISFLYYNALIIEGVIEDDGCQIRTGIKSAVKYGACYNDDWSFHPEKVLTKPDARAYGRAHHDVITDYRRVPQTLYGIKSCLVASKPVIFGLAVYPEFESEQFEQEGVLHLPRTGEREIAQHAVMLRAYDDEAKRFIVRNSYGTHWGLPKAPGHFSVPYELILEPGLASDFWVINATGIGQ